MLGYVLVFISMVFIGHWITLKLFTRNKIKTMSCYINQLSEHLSISTTERKIFKENMESWAVNYGSVDYLAKRVKVFTQLEELDNITYQLLLKIINKWKY